MEQRDVFDKSRSKIKLDVGCGASKREGFVGLDARPLPGVNIVHDIEDFPWPLPDSCASVVQLSHLIEHIPPVGYKLEVIRNLTPPFPRYGGVSVAPVIDVKLHRTRPLLLLMDELWRILEPGGEAWISGPYGCSHSFVQDPTHAKPINEDLFEYFTPERRSSTTEAPVHSDFYEIYRPRPWKWISCSFACEGFMGVVLSTIKVERA